MWCLLTLAFAADPESIFVDPRDLRVQRLPGVDTASTPKGDQSPALAAGLFLSVSGRAVNAPVEELRASISPDDARLYAGLLASAEPLAATLAREEAPFAATVGTAEAPRCHRARVERLTLTLVATGTRLQGQRPLPGSEVLTDGPCPAG